MKTLRPRYSQPLKLEPTPFPIDYSIPRAELPKDSVEYAYSTVECLRLRWQSVASRFDDVEEIIAEIEEAKAWERYPLGKPAGSLDALLRTAIEVDVREVRAAIKQARKTAKERAKAAAMATTGEVLPADGEVHPGNASQFANHTQAERAKANSRCGSE